MQPLTLSPQYWFSVTLKPLSAVGCTTFSATGTVVAAGAFVGLSAPT